MPNNEYEPFKYKFRIFGYLISLIGLFAITIPQNNWIIIPAIIQNIYTIRALKIGPHKDIFLELKKGNLLRAFVIGFVGFIYFVNIYGGFAYLGTKIFSIEILQSLSIGFGFCSGFYLVPITFNPDFGCNLKLKK